MNDQKTKLAEQLYDWAFHEMHYQPPNSLSTTKSLTVADFKKLYRGDLTNAWNFLIRCVRSERTVKTIRGNLKLAQTKSLISELQTKKKTLLEERDKLRAKLKAAEAKVCSVQNEFRQFSSEILSSERNIQELKNRILTLLYQNRLITAFNTKVRLFCTLLNNSLDQLKQILQRKMGRKFKGDEFITLFLSLCSSHSERNNSEMESNEFEPLHVRVVRQVCTTIQFLLDKVYRQTSNGTLHSEENIKDDTLTTKQLNECLEILFNSPSQLLDALSYIAHKQIQILQNSSEEKTLSLVGSSNKTKTEVSVRRMYHLLQELHNDHIQRSLSIQRHKLQTKEYSKELRNNNNNKENLVMNINRQKEITLSKQKLLRELYELELRLEAENSALIVCQTTERDLQQQKKFLTEESANLSSLFAQITQTESNLHKQQEQLLTLLAQNLSVIKAFETKICDLKQFITEKIQPQYEFLVTSLKTMKDFVLVKIQQFQKALYELKMREMTKEENFNTLIVPQYPRTFLVPLLRELGLVGFESPEFVLQHFVNFVCEVKRSEAEMNQSAQFFHFVQDENSEMIGKVETIEQGLNRVTKVHHEEWIPLLMKDRNEAQSAFKTCERLKEMLEEWWTQPAQQLTNWVTVDGLTLDQWREKWQKISERSTI